MTKDEVKVEVFEKVSCCGGGACGPNADPEAVAFTEATWSLRRRGIPVHLYSLPADVKVFAEHPLIKRLISESKGPLLLPITIVNNIVVKVGSNPTLAELEDALGMNNQPVQEGTSA
ncbi:MAG: arsenic metallochaperone ArsD family protein [Chloroflexi bacterium]|nr:arsenic metallochaperone ArsD family protein [Chloroflexota bacterium]